MPFGKIVSEVIHFPVYPHHHHQNAATEYRAPNTKRRAEDGAVPSGTEGHTEDPGKDGGWAMMKGESDHGQQVLAKAAGRFWAGGPAITQGKRLVASFVSIWEFRPASRYIRQSLLISAMCRARRRRGRSGMEHIPGHG